MADLIEWSIAKSALGGQNQSGDTFLVKELPKGALLAVVDGLGHGDEAAVVAKSAADIIDAHAGQGVLPLLRRCHQGLRDTRGVVASVAWLNASPEEMTWAGVGNVEGLLVRKNREARPSAESLLLRPGVLGDQMPVLQAALVPLMEGDTIVLATDGIRPDFGKEVKPDWPPQKIAAQILSQCAKGNDDALVLVARYKGPNR